MSLTKNHPTTFHKAPFKAVQNECFGRGHDSPLERKALWRLRQRLSRNYQRPPMRQPRGDADPHREHQGGDSRKKNILVRAQASKQDASRLRESLAREDAYIGSLEAALEEARNRRVKVTNNGLEDDDQSQEDKENIGPRRQVCSVPPTNLASEDNRLRGNERAHMVRERTTKDEAVASWVSATLDAQSELDRGVDDNGSGQTLSPARRPRREKTRGQRHRYRPYDSRD
ncbi:hypothetical protein BDP81DRAFT_473161 [Colletotrichum phormii]|uniref:Uncharacterized protein n=1 Tax=Colletotrichum phormii TaxID=359342 RepID=A0AAI9ZP33_9PEZI|nr:uncharacterized protein BDP81DRAFT_473161 [Colletotrichum phormii]KAK1634199.1 hypothetical protein BDP81DRAFT_473161 [Colletotrichum phormii]